MYIVSSISRTLNSPVLFPFALEELLGRMVAETGQPVLHLWKHSRALVLGLRDRRLTRAAQMIRKLEKEGYSVAVRHSGGAAVPLNQGVLNLTLLLPKSPGDIHYNADFETMYGLIQGAVKACAKLNVSVDKGEIAGSYCPGDFDLSIHGKKFCGMAQRRQVNVLAVQAFVILRGSASDLALTARRYYEGAAANEDQKRYPQVKPEQMASLEELLATGTLNESAWLEGLFGYMQTIGIEPVDQTAEAKNWFTQTEINTMIDKLKHRYSDSPPLRNG